MKIKLTLNKKRIEIDEPPMSRFLDVLRKRLGLTAAKEGCGEGECGSCSILLNGDVVNSCLLPTIQVAGARVETVESLADPTGALSNLQKCMVTSDGAQCGICTPGMLLTGTAYLRRIQANRGFVRAQDVRREISGNLCRCTGYDKIVDAILLAYREQLHKRPNR